MATLAAGEPWTAAEAAGAGAAGLRSPPSPCDLGKKEVMADWDAGAWAVAEAAADAAAALPAMGAM